jgi:hypothetical protein
MTTIARAIQSLKPDAEFSYQGEDYSTIKWVVLKGNAPTKKEIDDEIERLKISEIANAKAKETQRKAILDRLGLTADELAVLLG